MVRRICSEGLLAVTSSEPAQEKPVVTPKRQFEGQIKALYAELARTGVSVSTASMLHYYGRAQHKIAPFIVSVDPITKQPITFLGKRVLGGVNVYMLPILKAAEAAILRQGVTYKPAGSHIGGYEFRGMRIAGQVSKDILSSHATGLSLDIDSSANAPTTNAATNRGDIPDRVVLAMVEHGFVWGGVTRVNFAELGNDPMHFQFSLHKDDERYQEILRTSPVAASYLKALKDAGKLPPLPEKKGSI
jgi:hypothetical protein